MSDFFAELIPAKGPERVLAFGTLINTIGNGLFFTVSVLYFTRSVGLSAYQVGLGLTIAGAVGLLASVPGGHLADRIGPRNVAIYTRLAECILMAFYAFVDTFTSYLVLVVAISVFEAAGHSMRGALIARFGGPEGRVRLRAVLRAVTNLGMTFGALFGGLALAIDTKVAYQGAILLNAATIAAAAVSLLWLENLPPLPEAQDNKMTLALRDKPYVALTALNAVLSLHFMVLEIAIPLWISEHTTAPRWLVAVVLIINTAVVTLFQVRASRGSEDIRHAATVLRNASVVIAVALMIYASAALFVSPVIAAVVLCVGAFVHVYGELRQSAGSWGIGFGLPPEHAQGQYQGVWSLGFSFSNMIAPLLLTAVVIAHEIVGWALLAAIFLVAGSLAKPLTSWALRARELQS